ERQAALVAVQILEIGTPARPARSVAGTFEVRRDLDLDDVRPPVGELAHAGRARTDPGKVEDREPFKRARTFWSWHFCDLAQADFAVRWAAGAPDGRDIPRYYADCLPRSTSACARKYRRFAQITPAICGLAIST